MRILWVGDAVVSTGFARCTHKVCNYLHFKGHEIHVLGINYTGDPYEYPYAIYPCVNHYEGCHDVCGESRLPKLISKLCPDVVFILQDPWNISGYYVELDKYFEGLKMQSRLSDDFQMPLIYGWLAVDAKNQISGAECNRLDRIITWTQFGIDELRAGGYTGPSSIIPLGVDSEFYVNKGKLESRDKYLPESIPRDAFVVGTVGSNQYRKRLDLLIEYFAEWVKTCNIDDAYLYIHIGPTGERAVNIPALCKYYGLSGRVIVAMPPVGSGRNEQDMPWIYSLMNVFVTMTQGEGWGLPVLEAMSCSVPCIVPQWSALGEWTKNVAVQVPCTTYALNSPIGHWPYTIGGIADRDKTVEALNLLYRARNGPNQLVASQSRQLAESLSWDTVGEKFVHILDNLPPRWHKRPGTMDDITIREVYRDNCYHIPDNLKGLTCIDVGANIGSFSKLCLDRTAGRVIAVEPDAHNFDLLCKNLNTNDFRLEVVNKAVVGDMVTVDKVYISPTNHVGSTEMTGGQNIFEPRGEIAIETVKITDLLSAYSRVLLKLDCEGSEYQILYSDLPWDRIKMIVGETHTIGQDHPFRTQFERMGIENVPHEHESLMRHLEGLGYKVEVEDFYGTNCGLLNFKATRI